MDIDATLVTEEELSKSDSTGSQNLLASTAATVDSRFLGVPTTDVNGATDGSSILTQDAAGNFTVYDLAGQTLKSTSVTDFFCGVNPLAVCSQPGYFGDGRVVYDALGHRWVFSALYIYLNPPSNTPRYVVMAVSQTADPQGGFYKYQYPACGAFDTWDGSDQPHIGYSARYITIASACSAQNGVDGAGLAVFQKANLYSGGTLTLNTNWYEFVDIYSGGNYVANPGNVASRDTPVLTYDSIARQYLVAATLNASSNPVFIISEVTTGFPPTFISGLATVTIANTIAGGLPPVNAPGHPAWMQSLANGWTHSAGLFVRTDGLRQIVSTAVWGYPPLANSTQVVSVGWRPADGTAVSLVQLPASAGNGTMASEIAMPVVLNGANVAYVAYDISKTGFYPGVKAVTWDLDTGTTVGSTIKQGTATPTAGDQSRWVDFISAISPIPGTSQLVVGGTVAVPNSIFPADTERATVWATVTP